jgi:hypothetical protein
VATRPKATPRLSGGEAAGLELERSLACHLSPGRPLAAHIHAPEGMVLLRESPGFSGFFAGSLTSLSMEEVFAHVVSGVRSGLLIVQHGEVQRTLAFRDAQIIFATSTVRHERLGAAVVQLGLISPEQLHQALARVTPTQRIGQVLTRGGFVSEANLYSAMTYLVREVALNLFEMKEGSFLFLEGRPPESDAVKLSERTKDIVLQGIKRGEAVARLRRRFPDNTRVMPGPEGSPPPGEEELFTRAMGGVLLGDLRAAAWEGSLYAFLTWVEERVRDGSLKLVQLPARASTTMAAVAPPPPVPPLSPEERFNALLTQIHTALRLAGANPDLLRGFLESPPAGLEAAFQGVQLGPDGKLDVERLRRNVATGGAALARALTLEALDAFVSYALFSARNVLPPEMAERLARSYRDLQEGMA